jgi:hypothetical protein
VPDPVRLHLDADTAAKALHRALLNKGHDVTRTPTPWMPFDASDEQQLLGATSQGRAIFTFNIRDFVGLAERYPDHRGIVLAAQRSWTLSQLVVALDLFLSERNMEEVAGQVLWLNTWKG